MIHARLVPDPPAGLTPGEAVAGMMLHGLGFAHRPLSLTPHFFASTPLELWWHDGVRSELFTRCTLGRTRDEADAYGCDLLFQERAMGVCAREGLDLRFNQLDRTRFALRGAYLPASDEQAMAITHGQSRDPRPALQQVVWALLVAEDGGLPVVRTSGDGHPSDSARFQARAQTLRAAFPHVPPPRQLIADSKRYHEDNATHRRHLGGITRLPHTMGAVAEVITPALAVAGWHRLADHTRDPRLELGHDGMAPRWLVVSSQAAYERAAATRNNARHREREAIHQPLLHLQAKRFAMPEAAHEARTAVAKGWTYHPVDASHLSDPQRDARQGRPTPRLPVKAIAGHIQAHVRPAEAAIAHPQHRHACVVIGTTIGTREWHATEVITAYKRQSQVEGGCRFRNDPRLFVSSLFVKQPGRIQGLWMVMTLA